MNVFMIVWKEDTNKIIYTRKYGFCIYPEENLRECLDFMDTLKGKDDYKIISTKL
ncbi:hypothetical protein [Vibrio phage VpJYP1]|nr:hypothetical protein [Vibrio phage VpJYP1]